MVEFGKKDIVRHRLVQRIVEAYERHNALNEMAENSNRDDEPKR